MKIQTHAIYLIVFCLVLPLLVMPGKSEATDTSFAFKIGYNMFRSDDGWDDVGYLGDDASYFNGRNYSLELDLYPVRYFGLRFTLEYFRQNRRLDNGYGDPYNQDYYNDYRTLTIIPLTVSAKVRVPAPFVSPYFFAGFGFCYWGLFEGDEESHWYSDEEDDDLRLIQENDGVTFQAGTGLEFKLTPHVAFMLEGEYRSLIIDFNRYNDDIELNASSVLLTTGILIR
ncbi:outer membrane beta-barrel protein [bacterium]|nr:outer membrane beta-barrel protein [bacterium]